MKALLLFGFALVMSQTLHAEIYPLLVNNAEIAKYEVPVSSELKEYAEFVLPDFEKTVSKEKISVQYSLPELLTGNAEKIELKGTIQANQDEVILKGKKGTALCKGIQSVITCKVSYDNLNIDEDKAIEAIKNISTSDKEFKGRIEVLRSFSTDPVGIIFY